MEPLSFQWFRVGSAVRRWRPGIARHLTSCVGCARIPAHTRRVAGTAVVVLLMCTLPARSSGADGEFGRVRTLDPVLAELLEQGPAQSTTLARLLDEIERSDLIVYIERHNRFPRTLIGSFKLAGQSSGHRYARIALSTALDRRDTLIALAHELQHAAEVAASDVVDNRGMFELYCRIGDRRAGGFDTAAARLVTRQVSKELALGADR